MVSKIWAAAKAALFYALLAMLFIWLALQLVPWLAVIWYGVEYASQ